MTGNYRGIAAAALLSIGLAAAGETTKFHEFTPEPGRPQSGVLDFSRLNHVPAGKHGFLTAKAGNLFFADGTPVRFAGVNLSFRAATPEKKLAEIMAEELSRRGVNLVRLHAVEYGPGIVDYRQKTTRNLDMTMLDQLDYLVFQLKKRGIYLQLDINVGRQVKAGDGFTPEELRFAGSESLRAIQFFDERIIALELDFAEKYLTHRNPYTKMRYIDDPAVAIVQFVNESSITWFGAAELENIFTRQLNGRFNAWLLKKYGSRDRLDAAWTSAAGQKALRPDEDPAQGSVRSPFFGSWMEPFCDYRAAFTALQSPPRHADHLSFLAQLQTATVARFRDRLRQLGYRALINCSNQAKGALDIQLNAQCDIMERNAYWNHPLGPYAPPSALHQRAMSSDRPREPQPSEFSRHSAGVVAGGAAAGLPMLISEWNVTTPTPFRADALFHLIAYSSLQDWDGYCLFSYSMNGTLEKFRKDNWMVHFFSANTDPATWGAFGVAAWIYRAGLIRPAVNKVELVLTPTDLFTQGGRFWQFPAAAAFVSQFSYRFIDAAYTGDADLAVASGNTATGDYRAARHALIFSPNPFADPAQRRPTRDAWLREHTERGSTAANWSGFPVAVGARRAVGTAPAGSNFWNGADCGMVLSQALRHFGLIDAQAGWHAKSVRSDTGELNWQFGRGAFSVAAPGVNIFTGQAGPTERFGICELSLNNPQAAVALISLDGKPLAQSAHLLLYALGRCLNSNMRWDETAPKSYGFYDKLLSMGSAPLLLEYLSGTLTLATAATGGEAWALDYYGQRLRRLELAVQPDGRLRLPLTDEAMYYELKLCGDPQ